MSAAPPFVLERTAGVEGERGWPLYLQCFAEMAGS
jgi:hypothetical protein